MKYRGVVNTVLQKIWGHHLKNLKILMPLSQRECKKRINWWKNNRETEIY